MIPGHLFIPGSSPELFTWCFYRSSARTPVGVGSGSGGSLSCSRRLRSRYRRRCCFISLVVVLLESLSFTLKSGVVGGPEDSAESYSAVVIVLRVVGLVSLDGCASRTTISIPMSYDIIAVDAESS